MITTHSWRTATCASPIPSQALCQQMWWKGFKSFTARHSGATFESSNAVKQHRRWPSTVSTLCLYLHWFVQYSKYSTHLQAMYSHNFAFFDPNVWFHEDEMRKQIENLNGCCILTGQESTRILVAVAEDFDVQCSFS